MTNCSLSYRFQRQVFGLDENRYVQFKSEVIHNIYLPWHLAQGMVKFTNGRFV